jgi:hypothetical protein
MQANFLAKSPKILNQSASVSALQDVVYHLEATVAIAMADRCNVFLERGNQYGHFNCL